MQDSPLAAVTPPETAGLVSEWESAEPDSFTAFDRLRVHAASDGYDFFDTTHAEDVRQWADRAATALQAQSAQLAARDATIADLTERLERAEKEIAKQRRRATDAEYMGAAYHNMLGPKGREVADMWSQKGVQRIHIDWDTGAFEVDGEKRAEVILEWENAPLIPFDDDEDDGPEARANLEGRNNG